MFLFKKDELKVNFEEKTMKKFEIKESIKIPKILVDFERGVINFIGKSTLEKPEEFYPKIIEVITQYVNNPKQTTNVLIDLEAYNDKSANYLFGILQQLDYLTKDNKSELKIFWHYDPDDYGIIGDINRMKETLTCNVYALAYELA